MSRIFQSLRFRIILACVFFAVIVTIAYGHILTFGLRINEDELFNWYIAEQTERLLKKYHAGELRNGPLDLGGYVFVGTPKAALEYLASITDETPILERIRGADSLETISGRGKTRSYQGYRIIEIVGNRKTLFHIVRAGIHGPDVDQPQANTESLYVFVNIINYQFHNDNASKRVLELLSHAVIAVLVLAIIIGLQMARTVIAPLTRLSNSVDLLQADEFEIPKQAYYRDEVGHLARRINSFLLRMKAFVEREKRFSRDASHELRTPVASSQAALDVAMALPQGQDPKMQQVLSRIHRANKDMTHLIGVFLLLGREDAPAQEQTHCNLHQLSLASLKKNAYLVKNDEIIYETLIDPELYVDISEPLLAVVIDNLVRNAFQHTEQGRVHIHGNAEGLSVHDTGSGFPASALTAQPNHHANNDGEDRQGIGLTIVQRICQNQGWSFSIDSTATHGTVVSVRFSKSSSTE